MKINIKKALLALLVVPVLALSGLGGQSVSAYDITQGADAAKGDKTPSGLFTTNDGQTPVFKTIVNVLLYIIGAVSVIMLVIGGIRYTISQGDSSAVTAAKNTILYAVIGIVVAILAYAIVNFVITGVLNSTN